MDSGWPVQTSPSLESERKRSAERYPFREGRSDKGRCYDEVAPAGTCAMYCVDTALLYSVRERPEPLSRWQDEVAVSGQTNMMKHRNLRWIACAACAACASNCGGLVSTDAPVHVKSMLKP